MIRHGPDRLLPAVVGAVFLLASATAVRAQTSRLITVDRISRSVSAGQMVDRPHLNLAPAAGFRSRSHTLLRSARSGTALPDTLQILVLRLQFQPDDDPRTTGDGTFDLRDIDTFRSQEGHDIDATPHDRHFAQRHMRALHNYWWAMSDGKLSLEADVFPTVRDQAYELPREISYYGFETPLSGLIEAFETLVADAVAAAQQGSDQIDWDRYDTFVLLHAGAAWQGDYAGLGDTPADIPTAYVALGQPVPAGTMVIRDVTIIPETVSQDGFTGAINGSFAHEFGHQLGLPDLYDTVGGVTAVGFFALMDSGGEGGGVVDDLFIWGVLPAAISPWSRIFMGWEVPTVVRPGERIDLLASTALAGVHNPPAGVKVGMIHAGVGQSFLIEYRSDDLDGDQSVSLFWEEGVIDGTAALINGQKVRTYEYDALLPGSGVLIWHLDEVIAEIDPDGNGFGNFDDNTLQQDRLHRFLDVEEADGRQELGWFPGYLGEMGDFWNALPDGPSIFGSSTVPGTASWTGARTGLQIEVQSHADPLAVSLMVGRSTDYRCWSASIPAGVNGEISVPWMVDIEGDGNFVVALLDRSGGFHLFSSNGDPLTGSNPVWTTPLPPHSGISTAGSVFVVTAGDSLWFLSGNGEVTGRVVLDAPAVRRPVGYELNGNPTALVEIEGGSLLEVSTSGIQEKWQTDGETALVLQSPDLIPLVIAGNQLFRASRGSGGMLDLLWSGSEDIIDAAGFRGTVPGSSQPGIALLGRSGRLTLVDLSQGTGQEYGSIDLPEPAGRLAVAYLNSGRDIPSVIVPTVEGVIGVEVNGPRSSGWPPARRGRAALPAPHVVGTPLTIAYGVVAGVTDAGELTVYGPTGQLLSGGLRQLIREPAGALTLGAGDREEGPVLLFADSDSLFAISLGVYGLEWEELVWKGPGGGAGGGGWVYYQDESPAQPEEDLSQIYLYPNPARDRCTVRVEGSVGSLVVKGFTQSGSYLGEMARLEGSGPGVYEVDVDTSRLGPGVYFLIAEYSAAGEMGPLRRHRMTLLVIR